MIRVALNHKTLYKYDRQVELGPQIVRLRPAPHCRTPINSYSLSVIPEKHFINWLQDTHSNYQARIVFPEKSQFLVVETDLVAEMTVINPFDFFLEPDANEFPFDYEPALKEDLKSFLRTIEPGPKFTEFVESIDVSERKTIDFLVDLNQKVNQTVQYLIRMEHGVQSPEETLIKGSGSCRDSAWLLVQVLRHLGLAARFVSGYLIQLKPDVKSLDGPSGTEVDFTDLHAWVETFLPGAGWIGLDPTSGLLAGEGHIPLACTPEPGNAAPITGSVENCDVEFRHEMSVTRIHEDPRVTKPYTEKEWQKIESLGHQVDKRLKEGDVRLTMGGEPTFVSIDDMEGAEWKTDAVGPTKRHLAGDLIRRLKDRFAPKGLIHYGQGKWYPGESLPRWTLTCLWRTDKQPIWQNDDLLANPEKDHGHDINVAQTFAEQLVHRLDVNPDHVTLAYEDLLYYLWKERRLPVNADLLLNDVEDEEERIRIRRVLENGVKSPVGCILPLEYRWWEAKPKWHSGSWPVRSEHMFLIPGDSPMGLRLPLDSIPEAAKNEFNPVPAAPFEHMEQLRDPLQMKQFILQGANRMAYQAVQHQDFEGNHSTGFLEKMVQEDEYHISNGEDDDDRVIRKAMCFEPRDGTLHIFMPPADRLEDYLELVTAIEITAEELEIPVIIEGYLPPEDYRIQKIKVTPDPGVIEVNVHPAESWNELVDITSGLYEDARQSRLGTEKFDIDGSHTGTGGGNHVVLGARVPEDSPFLRRPDLLKSLLSYWQNHPSLSYLFCSKFIGPTSQAPRIDEGRRDSIYELQIAFEQINKNGQVAPWIVDRVFRNLLVDLTGNTHRSEFCIDKLYSPDTSTGRLGLVEFRAFEMPPHWQMSLTQQLLLRSMVSRFWDNPYEAKLVDWNTSIHDRWLLPHFVIKDFEDVIEEMKMNQFDFDVNWFLPHYEFRFPFIGELDVNGIHLELRSAIEPWYVLGEENAVGGTARYVDSSVERLQVKASGLNNERYILTCNGRKLPLHPTGTEGEYISGVRYRAWQPPSCLHPTIPVDTPLTFDILDTWLNRSVGGCTYHVGHPGGLNPDTFPLNAYEAESRRAGRYYKMGHTGSLRNLPLEEDNAHFPMTLDLRRNRNGKKIVH